MREKTDERVAPTNDLTIQADPVDELPTNNDENISASCHKLYNALPWSRVVDELALGLKMIEKEWHVQTSVKLKSAECNVYATPSKRSNSLISLIVKDA